jgi:hypothetical protein
MIQQLVDAKGLYALIGDCDFLARKYIFPKRRSGIGELNRSFSPAKLGIAGPSLSGA